MTELAEVVAEPQEALWDGKEGLARARELLRELPEQDNTSEALAELLSANKQLRGLPWPEPFDRTRHEVHLGDARSLDMVGDESVHLVVTSPPYWTLKKYNDAAGQLGHWDDYEGFLAELDKVWVECRRVLVPGGRVCCVVGDVCIPRRVAGRHHVVPLHADLQVRARQLGLDNLAPVHWYKVANGVTEAAGNGAGFYGKPYQPGAVVKHDIEYILFFRRGGTYRSPTPAQKALSMLSKPEMQAWFRSVWTDISGASTQNHPAPYPARLADRLIRMFSFAGDTVLDPFAGTGSTAVAALDAGRNSVSVEIDSDYHAAALRRVQEAAEARDVAAGPSYADVKPG